MHVSAVAAVNADGFAVHADREGRTQHRYEAANVGRSDDVLDHGALVGGLVERLDGRALALRLLGVALKCGLRDRLPGVNGVDVDAVGPSALAIDLVRFTVPMLRMPPLTATPGARPAPPLMLTTRPQPACSNTDSRLDRA